MKIEMGGHAAHMGEGRGVYRVLVVKREQKTRGKPRCSLEGNVKMDLLVVGCGVMDWIEVDQDGNRWRAL